MNVAVFGLGYVGCVSAACLADRGHHVVGVDISRTKIDRILRGESPILERGVPELIATATQAGRLRATTDAIEAVENSDLSLICVGTPSQDNGSLSLESLRQVAEQIGAGLRRRKGFHVVAVRSTMLPDALADAIIEPLRSASGLEPAKDFGVCVNPEFLREGSAVADYQSPPFTLIGSDDTRSGSMLADLYSDLDAPLIETDCETAALVKYASNAFHALKVCFANEIGRFSKALGADGERVMEIFSQDHQLNISERYLRPGFAFGGSCLPKDLRAILHRSRALDLDLHLLDSILPSNRAQIGAAHKEITRSGRKRIGVLGLSFKSGTDDLRESPMVDLVETLVGQGYDLRILDPAVSLANLIGTNRDYIESTLPHIASLLVSKPHDLLAHAEIVVKSGDAPEFDEIIKALRSDQSVIDLSSAPSSSERRGNTRRLSR